MMSALAALLTLLFTTSHAAPAFIYFTNTVNLIETFTVLETQTLSFSVSDYPAVTPASFTSALAFSSSTIALAIASSTSAAAVAPSASITSSADIATVPSTTNMVWYTSPTALWYTSPTAPWWTPISPDPTAAMPQTIGAATSTTFGPVTSPSSNIITPASSAVITMPTPIPSVPAASSPSSNGLPSTSPGSSYTGDLTYYSAGLGSCGHVSSDADAIVAVSHVIMQAYSPPNPNDNPLCGRTVQISFDGVLWNATVLDTCEGCDESNLDLSQGFFGRVTRGQWNVGRFHGVDWAWL